MHKGLAFGFLLVHPVSREGNDGNEGNEGNDSSRPTSRREIQKD
jgi:hypothetical protein